VNGPLLGDDPAVGVSVHIAALATAGIGSPPWAVVGTSSAERRGVFEQKTTRREFELVRDAWPGRAFAHVEAIRRGVPETGRTPSNASSTSLSLPRTPGIRAAAAGTRLCGCSASADREHRCAYSSPRRSERRYADD
jgi:hypothetical protein